MKTAVYVGAALAVGWAVTAAAEDFPLTFKKIAPKDIVAFPGGYGVGGQLRTTKPTALKNEPKAASSRPLYGEFRQPGANTKPLMFRLDESGGTGKGYDRLITDVNENGDLTDDAVVSKVVLPTDRKTANPNVSQQVLFGPIEVPGVPAVAGGQPFFYAQGYVNPMPPGMAEQNVQSMYAGYIRFKSGWYVETTVSVKGIKQKVGIFDGDSNLRLGDIPASQTYTSGSQQNWYFVPGDTFLVDADGSGAFENDTFQSESSPFSRLLYLGTKPYKVSLESGCTTLRLTAWDQPLAQVTVEPRGAQVRRLTLACEQEDGKWEQMRATVADGKAQVPPGKYRVYAVTLEGKAAAKDQVMVSGYQRVPKTPVEFKAGQANTLRCGGPLDIKVTAEKKVPEQWEASRQAKADSDSDYVVSINATVCGVDGEVYSSFGKGESFRDDPPLPKFVVVDASGKKVANGNLEFG